MNIENLLGEAIVASVKAGKAIRDVYHSDFSVEYKSDDSPLTIADKRAHEIISGRLQKTGIPILSEEGKGIDFMERQKWDTLWIVDPLDGTKEFIKRNDEFTVNIALIMRNRPVLGVIFVPVFSALYFAAEGFGAWKLADSDVVNRMAEKEAPEPGLLRQMKTASVALPHHTGHTPGTCRIVGSRSHATPELEAFVDRKREEYQDVAFLSAGSSLKFCLVAEGAADLYPRLGPTMEWDTAAGQAIAEQSGCRVLRWDTGEPLMYNREDLLNPFFIVSRMEKE